MPKMGKLKHGLVRFGEETKPKSKGLEVYRRE